MSHSPGDPAVDVSSSRAASPSMQPQNAAEVRSQAVAMLKRAASLPRRTDIRRPSNPSGPAPPTPQPQPVAEPYYASLSTPQRDVEEILSPSPSSAMFNDHYEPYHLPQPHAGPSSASSTPLQRSASASSSYHIPTPPSINGYSQISTPLIPSSGMVSPMPLHLPDWSAVQLAQSYLPSLSPVIPPVPAPPSSFISPSAAGKPPGRNTPSPLPSLGEIRNLQRSNSAAARSRALDKLTGGREAPLAREDHGDQSTPTKGGLQRADSLGAPRMLGSSVTKITGEAGPADHPPSAFIDPRPKLQRSFTVSSSNMGEERRSAVGRRMVARLGERRAMRDPEEEDVRRLWEERRGVVGPEPSEATDIGSAAREVDDEAVIEDSDDGFEGADDEEERLGSPGSNAEAYQDQDDSGPEHGIPGLRRYSPVEPEHDDDLHSRPPTQSGALSVPVDDRPYSRTTQHSEGDAFEYESHLRRSLSSRTARGTMGTVQSNAQSGPSRQAQHASRVRETMQGEDEYDEDEQEPPRAAQQASDANDLEPPSFVTPSRMTPSRNHARGSASTKSTHSPGADSITSGDGLQSMLFVMGAPSGAAHGAKRETNGFPVDVGEGMTSTWGTPAKDAEIPASRSAASTSSPTPSKSTPTIPSASAFGDTLTPPDTSVRSSMMSWEELGGEADREIPSEANYSKKSGSISSKVGRVVKGMRKRSQSRSSTGSAGSPPTSPRSVGEALSVAVQSFSRRGSQSSVSPSQASVGRSFTRGSPMTQQSDHMRHQPSISSLAPSVLDESSANGLLLQHQLTNDPQPIREMPRAKIDDPRVFNSKLSPFPGVEGHARKLSDVLPPALEVPKLIHQSSDSAVPSQQRVTPQTVDSHSLPLPAPAEHVRRGSDDSTGRKGWLAKAFASGSTPRSSAGTSRKSSLTDSSNSLQRSSPDKKQLAFADQDGSDPFAAPPPPSVVNWPRAVSPSVSTVAEANEDGHRLTQFTMHRSATHTPVTQDIKAEPAVSPIAQVNGRDSGDITKVLPPKSVEVLARMDEVLALAPDDPARPDILDDPPRKLLLATQVLQVVNLNTVKDRYLLLFNDILVICKPIIDHGTSANLDMQFLVKSIVSLDKLHATGFKDDHSHHLLRSIQRDPQLQDFISEFASDSFMACANLVERRQWTHRTLGLASVLFKVPELNKGQLGILLSAEQELLSSYVNLFNFTGISIDEALRMFLLAVRLPGDGTGAERTLTGLAHGFFGANKKRIPYDLEATHSLIKGMMMLNDSIHGGTYGFALHNPGLTAGVWVAVFREQDPNHLVSTDLLESLYTSIERDPLHHPLSPDEAGMARPVQFTPEKASSRLILDTWSEAITVSLPAPDSDFVVKLLSEGLEADPPVLDFARSRQASFRVKGLSVGIKTLLLARTGKNAALYPGFGNALTFQVEPSFMRCTFHIGFANHLGHKRRYCFSVPDHELRTKWGVLLPRQISITRQKRSVAAVTVATTPQQRIRLAAEGVALHVLRDALIPPPPPTQISLPGGKGRSERAGSVSVICHPDGERNGVEGDFNGGRQENTPGPGSVGPNGSALAPHAHSLMEETTGKEVVLVCRQNSLLPGMLELLQAGVDPKAAGPPPTATATARGARF